MLAAHLPIMQRLLPQELLRWIESSSFWRQPHSEVLRFMQFPQKLRAPTHRTSTHVCLKSLHSALPRSRFRFPRPPTKAIVRSRDSASTSFDGFFQSSL